MGKFLSALQDLLFVPRCAGCRTRMSRAGDGLCPSCLRTFRDAKDEFCPVCGFSVSICRCLPQNLLKNGCSRYRKLLFYKTGREPSVMRNMIYSVKRGHHLPAIRFLGREMAKIEDFPLLPGTVVTFVPRTESSVRKYGYDQGELLAKACAEAGGMAFDRLLARTGTRKKEQKLLNFRQRAANVRGAFCVTDPQKAAGKPVLLVDDVLTSGATAGECAAVLYAAGALDVSVLSAAYTYRKKKPEKD